MPLDDEPRRRFEPSKWEMMRVNKIVQAIKEGKYKTLKERLEEKKGDRNKGPFMVIILILCDIMTLFSAVSFRILWADLERCRRRHFSGE